jgi:hypothetical protein
MPLFLIFISQLHVGMEMSTFKYSNFAWGLYAWWCGRGGLLVLGAALT